MSVNVSLNVVTNVLFLFKKAGGSMSQNGKGDRNRIADRKKFRDNMDAIFNNSKKEDKEMPQNKDKMSSSYPKKKKAAKKVTKKKVTKKPAKKTKKAGY